MRIKTSKKKKIVCLTFCAFCAFYAFYAFYAFRAFVRVKSSCKKNNKEV